MKNLFSKILFVVLVAVLGGMLTGCNPETSGSFSVSIKQAGPDYVELAVSSSTTYEVGYLIQEDELDASMLADPFMIFVSGTKASVSSSTTWKIEGLQSERHYYLYIVARLNADDFTSVISLQFDTTGYGFDDLLTVLDTYYDGYKIHVHLPDEAREKGNAIRYNMSNLAMYLKLKDLYGTTDREMLLNNGDAYRRALTRDHTFIINDDNINWLDEDGNEVVDEDTNEAIPFHDPIVPGEPVFFIAGEFCYGDSETLAGISGWGDGYFGALWDNTIKDLEGSDSGSEQATKTLFPEITLNTYNNESEDKYWYGAFDKKFFKVKEPSLMDAKVDVAIPESGISVTDAKVQITMEDGVYGYCYAIMDMPTYNAMLSLLDGRKDLIQWFLTSYLAMYELGVERVTEDIEINAGSQFVGNHLSGRTDYIICVTAMGDDEGTTQSYVEQRFKTKDLTLDQPIIQVTPVYTNGSQEMSDPFKATFNVKYMNPDDAGELKKCYWAADYKREWDKSTSTYQSIVGSNYDFTDDEMLEICSEDGYDISFDTLDGEVMRLVVYGYNEEWEYNVIDAAAELSGADCPAIADYESPYAEAKATVSTTLFTDLVGEWTATAKIRRQDDNGNEQIVSYTSRENIEISYGAPAYPSDLYNSVKAIYQKLGVSDEDTHDYCDAFEQCSEAFGRGRVINQNRLLCTGFIDFDYYHYLAKPMTGRLDKYTPYDLFTDLNYSSVDVAQIFYDFGPKWFIEVDANGDAFVPFDASKLVPMHSWGSYENYVAACTDKDAGYLATLYPRDDIKGFPVTVSSDKKTITVGSIKMSDVDGNGDAIYEEDGVTPRKSDYYMNAIGIQNGSSVWVTPIVGEIVLQKVETSSSSAMSKAARSQWSGVTPCGAFAKPVMEKVELPKRPVMKTKSNVVDLASKIKHVEYRVENEPNIITMESLNKAIDNYYNRYISNCK